MMISICIPTYNQVQYLEKSIYSALNQTFRPFEIIVSNDCSMDMTKSLLRGLALKIPELIVVNRKNNVGIAKNVDSCLRIATGDYIVRLDSDDLLAPNYCEILSDLLEKYPEAGYAHANVQEIDQEDFNTRRRILYRNDAYQNATDALIASVKGYKVAANIIMFRKKALQDVNYLTNRPDYTEDYHLSVDLAVHGWGNTFSNQILSYYRVWVDTENIRIKRKLIEVKGVTRVFNEMIEPAYLRNHWDMNLVNRSKECFACGYTSYLKDYTDKETYELINAIKKLCSSRKTHRHIWMNMNGYNKFFVWFDYCKRNVKSLVKRVLLAKNNI